LPILDTAAIGGGVAREMSGWFEESKGYLLTQSRQKSANTLLEGAGAENQMRKGPPA